MAYTFSIQCRASDVLNLSIVNGEVVLANADPTDDRQAWRKDVGYSAGLKDEAGRPAFALVNKATGDALKHSMGYRYPVRAIKIKQGYLDESVLWAESEDLGGGFRRIHMVNNADYIFDAEEGTPECGGARDGTRLILFRWNGGENQLWRMAPSWNGGAGPEHATPLHVVSQSNQNLCLAARDGTAVLAHSDHYDKNQHWFMIFRNTGRVTDEEGHRPFALVNRSTGKALRRSLGEGPVELVGYSPDAVDVALLWTRSDDVGEGFHFIRTVGDVGQILDAAEAVPDLGGAHDGTRIIMFPWNGGPNQRWKMLPLYFTV